MKLSSSDCTSCDIVVLACADIANTSSDDVMGSKVLRKVSAINVPISSREIFDLCISMCTAGVTAPCLQHPTMKQPRLKANSDII